MNKNYDPVFGFALLFYFAFIFFIAFTIGHELAINKAINIIESEMSVSTDQISLENVRYQINALKVNGDK